MTVKDTVPTNHKSRCDMLIGILQAGQLDRGDVPFPEYDELYPAMLEGHGLSFKAWKVLEGDFPDDVRDADGWLISGSRHGAYEPLPWIPRLEEFIRVAFTASVPVVGICFGHQVMAQALGGRVEKFEGGWSVGLTEYPIEGRTYALNAWHQDQVVKVPPGSEVVGSTDFCENAALLYPGKGFSVQPHPEFENDITGRLLDHRAEGVVEADRIRHAREKLSLPHNNADMASRIAAFFKETVHG